MQKMNQAITMYQAAYGVYPCAPANNGTRYLISGQSVAIPGVQPEFLQTYPTIERTSLNDYYAYICMPDGSEYKLVRLVDPGKTYPSVEPHDKDDPYRAGRGWGYWSSDWAASHL